MEEEVDISEYTAAQAASERKQSTEISVNETKNKTENMQLGITEHVIFAQTINKRVMEPLIP